LGAGKSSEADALAVHAILLSLIFGAISAAILEERDDRDICALGRMSRQEAPSTHQISRSPTPPVSPPISHQDQREQDGMHRSAPLPTISPRPTTERPRKDTAPPIPTVVFDSSVARGETALFPPARRSKAAEKKGFHAPYTILDEHLNKIGAENQAKQPE